jgi:hypothetical protein
LCHSLVLLVLWASFFSITQGAKQNAKFAKFFLSALCDIIAFFAKL